MIDIKITFIFSNFNVWNISSVCALHLIKVIDLFQVANFSTRIRIIVIYLKMDVSVSEPCDVIGVLVTLLVL